MMIEPLILEVRQGFAATNQRLDAIEKRMYSLERKFDVFSIESTEIKANILDARNRLDELERKAS
jgi:archaellum component FlaC